MLLINTLQILSLLTAQTVGALAAGIAMIKIFKTFCTSEFTTQEH
jgi:hypothetical protein